MPAPKKRKKPSRKAEHRALLRRTRPRYEEMLEAQGGVCAIQGCNRKPSPTRRLDMDHDHKLMYVRGLLCVPCNRSLRSWMTPAWLRAAADYLDRGDPGWS